MHTSRNHTTIIIGELCVNHVLLIPKGLRYIFIYIKLSNCCKAISQLVTVTIHSTLVNPDWEGSHYKGGSINLLQPASIHLFGRVEIYPCQPGLWELRLVPNLVQSVSTRVESLVWTPSICLSFWLFLSYVVSMTPKYWMDLSEMFYVGRVWRKEEVIKFLNKVLVIFWVLKKSKTFNCAIFHVFAMTLTFWLTLL